MRDSQGSKLVSGYLRWVCRHAGAVTLVMGVVTLFLAVQIVSLDVEVDPDSQLPQEHPYIRALARLNDVFGEKNLVFIGLFPKDGDIFTPAFWAKLGAVTERIERLPGLVERSFLSLTLPKVAEIRGEGDDLVVEPVAPWLPRTATEAAAIKARLERNPQYLGILAAPDGSAAAIVADFDLSPPLGGYPQIRRALEEILAAEDDGTFTAHLGGPVIYVAWLAHYSQRMFVFFPIALVMIALVHYEAFRTVQAVFLPLLTAIMAMVWSLGILGLVGVTLDPFNVTTPILILAVAAGHAVQMLKRYYEELPHGGGSVGAIVRAGASVGPVMIVAALIAAASFLSLLTFETRAIRNFGLFTALGILSALAIEMTLIPAVRALLPDPSERELSRERSTHAFDRLTEALSTRVVGRGAPLVLLSAAVIAIGAAWAATSLRVDSSFRRQFSPSARVRVDDHALNASFGGTSTLVLLVDGGAEGAIDEPAVLGAIDRIQAWLAEQPEVGKTLSVADFVRRMHAVMTNAELGGGTLPSRRDLIAQYWLLYSMSGQPDDFASIIDSTHRLSALRVYLKDDRTELAKELIARLEKRLAADLPPGVRVEISGSLASAHAMNEVMVDGKIRNVAQIAVFVLLISSAVLRSWLAGLLVVIPLAFAVLTNFAVMALLGIPLDIGTSAISAMAVGIGADYAIYFLYRLREELSSGSSLADALAQALRTSGKAILFVSSAIAAGYLTLCFSGFAYHVRLGSLVAFAMMVSSVASLTVLPAAVWQIRPRFLGPGVSS